MNETQIDKLDQERQRLIAATEYQQEPLETIRAAVAEMSSRGSVDSQQLARLRERQRAIEAQIAAWTRRIDEIESILQPSMAGAQPAPSTQQEFDLLMETVDKDLADRKVPVHARQLQAVGEVAKRLKIGIFAGPLSRTPPATGDYRRANLSKHILHWFQERYGDRLKIDMSLGRAVVSLRGDAWLIRIPYIAGRVRIIGDRDIQREYPSISGPAKPADVTLNFLCTVEDLSPAMAKGLSDEEVHQIYCAFAPALTVFLLLDELRASNALIAAAKEDLQKAAEISVRDRTARGFSRWHSLQAVEKLLKAFIAAKGAKFDFSHKLKDLATTAHSLGGTALNPGSIALVQCSASVRYDPAPPGLEETVTAHHEAVALSRLVLADIKSSLQAARTV